MGQCALDPGSFAVAGAPRFCFLLAADILQSFVLRSRSHGEFARVGHGAGAEGRLAQVLLWKPIWIAFTARFGDQSCEGYSGDLSVGGALLVVHGDPADITAAAGEVTLDGLPRMRWRLIGQDAMGLHVQFMNIDTPAIDAVNTVIERSLAADEIHISAAQSLAGDASDALQAAVGAGEISLTDLFDTEYQPVAGTDPVQCVARHTAVAERRFPAIIEPPLAARDSQIVFCCITDRDGYIAAHNRKFSEPQRPADVVWNTAHARNRRIFNDTAGILAARGTKPRVLTYSRDMGGGNFVILKEVGAPIQIDGQHWGAVRMVLKL